jgi:hypothetical protein
MLKVALLATVVLVAASTAAVEIVSPEPAPAVAGAAQCRPDPSPTLTCAPRLIDADADGTLATVEVAKLILPAAPIADWTLSHPAQDLGLDFKDAAADPGSVLSMSVDREHSQPVVPAMFALGALLVLLRRRPT